jgi:hypothetical protein
VSLTSALFAGAGKASGVSSSSSSSSVSAASSAMPYNSGLLKGFQPGAIPNMFGRPGLLPNKFISSFSGSSGSSGINRMPSFMPSTLGTTFSTSFGGATAFGSAFGSSSSSSSSGSIKSGSCFSRFEDSPAGKAEVIYHKKQHDTANSEPSFQEVFGGKPLGVSPAAVARTASASDKVY